MRDVSEEVPLRGGRVTAGVVRVGDTVRRPINDNSPLVRELFTILEQRGFGAAPRYSGSDEQGREVFSFVAGDVPAELDASLMKRSRPPRS